MDRGLVLNPAPDRVVGEAPRRMVFMQPASPIFKKPQRATNMRRLDIGDFDYPIAVEIPCTNRV